eukprot:CAMPEP_0170094282 /NCGR_PEP_ID=MMETSP0019_2-20121128/27119_1 /TAXON_ID=98059 /ORGANISM="Dinobryon sp., Strain UTEXLB2267" /LENGTH=90 /DNA_ID=CAMNT_0010315495 /DNA_START=297 /DNA_END=566 /DNA_ORIENTATION=+
MVSPLPVESGPNFDSSVNYKAQLLQHYGPTVKAAVKISYRESEENTFVGVMVLVNDNTIFESEPESSRGEKVLQDDEDEMEDANNKVCPA